MKKPKNNLFIVWEETIGSIGDLGPGYPVLHWKSRDTKLGKILRKIVGYEKYGKFIRFIKRY